MSTGKGASTQLRRCLLRKGEDRSLTGVVAEGFSCVAVNGHAHRIWIQRS